MSLSPFFKSPLTDFSGAVVSHQWGGRCANLELKALDCLEAYGLDRGVKVCESLILDFQECSLRTKENQRYLAMRAERERQYKSGERSKEDRYAPSPQPDSY
ncbi:Ndufs5 domain containing protein [Asbolus verrucosus]|uniref:Ndufs5 domain containing protein n=1 Tax=Asbolus verrucosus TaxID=1661398 RepID=A0A482WDB6_ASBVE|nr:Ndufs5 domain containing protein [Asbolus verrucosus]